MKDHFLQVAVPDRHHFCYPSPFRYPIPSIRFPQPSFPSSTPKPPLSSSSAKAMKGRFLQVDIDFEKEPIGTGKSGKSIYFKDIWPSNDEIAQVVQSSVLPDMFKSTYEAITKGNPIWNQLSVPASILYSWDPNSTYIHEPPYFKNMTVEPPGPHGVKDAYCLLNFGDSITTDHISPAGSIQKDSPAAKFLLERGVDKK